MFHISLPPARPPARPAARDAPPRQAEPPGRDSREFGALLGLAPSLEPFDHMETIDEAGSSPEPARAGAAQ